MSPLTSFRISTFAFPRDRRIGDCQVAIDTNWVGALEVTDGSGQTGIGFFLSLFAPLPTAKALRAEFKMVAWPGLEGERPETLVHRVSRPRGGNVRALPHDLGSAVDQALWDLAARRAGMPLHRYLGGIGLSPRAYASGLEFHLSDDEVETFYSHARADGYAGYKVKVGHPDPEWDVRRLQLVQRVVGDDAILMADANEAWTQAETRRRISLFAARGVALHWIEDPILRSDSEGLSGLRGSIGTTLVNSGEYLGVDGRIALIRAGAADVVQLGRIGEGLRVAHEASAAGLPVAVGNTTMNVGAHLAAALPEVDFVEDSRLNTTDILAEPLRVAQGRFVLPETPGHGLALAHDAHSRCGGDRA